MNKLIIEQVKLSIESHERAAAAGKPAFQPGMIQVWIGQLVQASQTP